MTCRHRRGDPECSNESYSANEIRAFLRESNALKKAGLVEAAAELDAAEKSGSMIRTGAEVVTMERFGCNLVLQLKPRGSSDLVCVYRNVSELDLLKWRTFRTDFSTDPTDHSHPIALFPPTKVGWATARALAQTDNP